MTKHDNVETLVSFASDMDSAAENLHVDGALRMTFDCGVDVAGSAAFTSASNSSSSSSHVTFTYKRLMNTESLHAGPDTTAMIDDTYAATHVVSAITYGVGATVIFESQCSSKEESMHVSGHLEVQVKAMFSGEINADWKKENESFVNSFTIKGSSYGVEVPSEYAAPMDASSVMNYVRSVVGATTSSTSTPATESGSCAAADTDSMGIKYGKIVTTRGKHGQWLSGSPLMVHLTPLQYYMPKSKEMYAKLNDATLKELAGVMEQLA